MSKNFKIDGREIGDGVTPLVYCRDWNQSRR